MKLLKKLWCWLVGHHADGCRVPEGIILRDPYCRRCGHDIDDFPEKRGRVGKIS